MSATGRDVEDGRSGRQGRQNMSRRQREHVLEVGLGTGGRLHLWWPL